MNLSNKTQYYMDGQIIYTAKDVREAVRKLKDRIIENDIYTADELFRLIKEVFGEKLV